MKKHGLLNDAKNFVGWCEFCEPQQYPFEFVGVRSSPATYMEQQWYQHKIRDIRSSEFTPLSTTLVFLLITR